MPNTTVYNQYNGRPNIDSNDGVVYDPSEDPDMCDPIGYEPLEQQILDSYRAGDVFNAYMRDTYPNGATDDDISSEETSEPFPYGLDELDSYDLAKSLMNRLLSQQLEAQAQANQSPPTPTPTPTPTSTTPSN